MSTKKVSVLSLLGGEGDLLAQIAEKGISAPIFKAHADKGILKALADAAAAFTSYKMSEEDAASLTKLQAASGTLEQERDDAIAESNDAYLKACQVALEARDPLAMMTASEIHAAAVAAADLSLSAANAANAEAISELQNGAMSSACDAFVGQYATTRSGGSSTKAHLADAPFWQVKPIPRGHGTLFYRTADGAVWHKPNGESKIDYVGSITENAPETPTMLQRAALQIAVRKGTGRKFADVLSETSAELGKKLTEWGKLEGKGTIHLGGDNNVSKIDALPKECKS